MRRTRDGWAFWCGSRTPRSRRSPGCGRTGWRRKVVVVAVRDQRLVETYFRTALQSSDKVAAIAVPAFDTVPGWTPHDATTYDQRTTAKVRSRVILNPRYFQPTNKDNAQLLTHEVTHVATQAAHLAGRADLAAGGHRRLHGLPRPAAVRGHACRRRCARRSTPGRSSCRRTTSTSTTSRRTTWRDSSPVPSSRTGTARPPCAAGTTGWPRRRARSRPTAQTQKVTKKVLGLSTSQLSHEVAAYAAGIAH